MATMRDIVSRALRLAGISDIAEGVHVEQASDGLEALNAMMHSWALEGVDTEHTTLGLSDTFPLPAKFEDGTAHLLAVRVLPSYQLPATFDPDGFFRAMQAHYVTVPDAEMPPALLFPPSRGGWIIIE